MKVRSLPTLREHLALPVANALPVPLFALPLALRLLLSALLERQWVLVLPICHSCESTTPLANPQP